MDIVFSNYDICYIIWNNLDAPTINSLAHLSKLFNKLNQDFYQKKLKSDYLDPANELYKQYINNSNRLILYMEHDLVTYNMVKESMINVTELIHKFFENNLWIALVNDFDLMQDAFYHLTYLNSSYNYYKCVSFLKFLFEEQLYKDVLNAFGDIKPFLYVEYPMNFNVIELKQLARFKRVRKVNKKNRSQLIHSLRRPNDETYILSIDKKIDEL